MTVAKLRETRLLSLVVPEENSLNVDAVNVAMPDLKMPQAAVFAV